MAKEWILNMATYRWGLNKKDSVGPVSSWIRECGPCRLPKYSCKKLGFIPEYFL